ncbi:hypothetical protein E2C01_041964 [Portunus trituberculatus]|uniref:Uncharacterized protein n=1 Tax=Portunus trituberculatus TaxID=210409 RepID=A0A5B7FRS2_PORTR|nr:hypothetical protein [Portunus trituberculatus]
MNEWIRRFDAPLLYPHLFSRSYPPSSRPPLQRRLDSIHVLRMFRSVMVKSLLLPTFSVYVSAEYQGPLIDSQCIDRKRRGAGKSWTGAEETQGRDKEWVSNERGEQSSEPLDTVSLFAFLPPYVPSPSMKPFSFSRGGSMSSIAITLVPSSRAPTGIPTLPSHPPFRAGERLRINSLLRSFRLLLRLSRVTLSEVTLAHE